ncbi:hypothetical protein IWW45_007133, partial [Coemansia sp. RSA 485]
SAQTRTRVSLGGLSVAPAGASSSDLPSVFTRSKAYAWAQLSQYAWDLKEYKRNDSGYLSSASHHGLRDSLRLFMA